MTFAYSTTELLWTGNHSWIGTFNAHGWFAVSQENNSLLTQMVLNFPNQLAVNNLKTEVENVQLKSVQIFHFNNKLKKQFII